MSDTFQEEFNVIVEQFEITDKLERLEKMIAQQPEGSCGVPLSDVRPSSLMRSASCKVKQAECDRLRSWLDRLDRFVVPVQD